VSVRFTKAHGLGNDFILAAESEAPEDRSEWVRGLCHRHRGVGGDGVVLHSPAPDGIRMLLYNADGNASEISGNGLRCLAALAVREGWAPAEHTVETVVGPRRVEVSPIGPTTSRIVTDLGEPILTSSRVPIDLDPPQEPVVEYPVEVLGRTEHVTATSMGNPHCAVFLDEPADDTLVTTLGPALENHPLFPERTNVEFVTVVSRDEIRVRFWERGVGPTEASGTGSASAAVAAILNGYTHREVRAVCDGGILEIAWPEDGTLRQTGEVEIVCQGEWLGG
jgi:diaminopimelate epimerase